MTDAYSLITPIAICIYNRPGKTARIFEAIARVRPRRLLIVADGPNRAKEGDVERTDATRKIFDKIPWKCEVERHFSEENLGCRRRVSSGIDWVFRQTEEAIILEDDTVPAASFFPFCQELLERYRDDQRISMISGNNFQQGLRRNPFSYYFSLFTHTWGWAGWRRAWRHYDVAMKLWPEVRASGILSDLLQSEKAAAHWTQKFDAVYSGKLDTWNYQWTFTSWTQHQLVILPQVNLVTNIGFDVSVTPTRNTSSLANLPAVEIEFPLAHPPYVMHEMTSDAFTADGGISSEILERRKRFALTLLPNAIKPISNVIQTSSTLKNRRVDKQKIRQIRLLQDSLMRAWKSKRLDQASRDAGQLLTIDPLNLMAQKATEQLKTVQKNLENTVRSEMDHFHVPHLPKADFHPAGPYILCYAPYATWRIHLAYEKILTLGLIARGAQVRTIGCDAQLVECDLHKDLDQPRTGLSCHQCMAYQVEMSARVGLDIEWLGSFINPEEREMISAWSRQIADRDLLSAVYKEYPLGEYIQSSINTWFRIARIDLSNPRIAEISRVFLEGAALTWEGWNRLIGQRRPDCILMFSGRFYSHQVVLEIARRNQIRVITHERASVDNSLSINENTHILDFGPHNALWEQWKAVPLSTAQCEETNRIFRQREKGKNTGFASMVSHFADGEKTVRDLQLDTHKKIFCLFTSSEDELVSFAGYKGSLEQGAWVGRVMDFFAQRDDCQLIIRVHPFSGGLDHIPANQQFLDDLEEVFHPRMAPNIRLVRPRDVANSYALLRFASGALTYVSTIALEAAAKGVPVLHCGGGLYREKGFSISLARIEDLEKELERLVSIERNPEWVRMAYRFAYHLFLRMGHVLSLTALRNSHHIEWQFSDPAAVVKGKDAVLDRICDFILERGPLFPPPPSFSEKTYQEETMFIQSIFQEAPLNPSATSFKNG